MSLGPFFSPKEGFTTAKQKILLQRQSIGFLYPAKKVFSIQIPVFSIQTTVYYISVFFEVGRKGGFLTATVSDLPIQPTRSFISAKIIFLAFKYYSNFGLVIVNLVYPISAPGFWLYLFGLFGFYYSNFGLVIVDLVYPISSQQTSLYSSLYQ